jgi:hypothetical protein
MGKHSYDVGADSAAPPEVVFDVVADGARWRDWAGGFIRHSSLVKEGNPPPNGVGSIKKLGSPPVFSREETLEYDPPRRFGYRILGGPLVNNYKAQIELTPKGNGTSIRWSANWDPKLPGTGRLVERWFTSLIGGTAQRLAKHAERVHETGNRSTTS